MHRIVFVPLVCTFLAPAAEVKVMEEIVAKVNGDIVTQTEITKSRLGIRDDLQRRGLKGKALDDAVEEKEKDILRDRIDQLLLIQKGKDLSINVDPEISKQLAEIQSGLAKQNPQLADPEKFQAYLHEQTGMSFEDYKSEMRNGMLTQRVIRQEIGGRINIPDADKRKFYNDHKAEFVREDQIFLSEIFLSNEGKDPAALERKAKDLAARAKKGERFGELARDNSDADSAQDYGQLPGRKKEDLQEELVALLWDKPKGFVTDPLKRTNGWLILRVEEHHKPGQAEYEEVENIITERLYMPIFQPKIREYLTSLRQDAFLEIKEGWVDTSAAPGKSTKWTDPAELKPETVSKEEVANQTRRKRLLWAIPIPGTKSAPKSTSQN